VWQGTLPIDVAQTIRFCTTPAISGTGIHASLPPIVNTAWMTQAQSGVVVSATAIANGHRVWLLHVLRDR
jgi:hypothetical protein